MNQPQPSPTPSHPLAEDVRRERRDIGSLVVIVLSLAVALIPFHAKPAGAQGAGTSVASGLNGPMGVMVTSDGAVWVIDTGVGGDQELEILSPMTGEPTAATFGSSARIIRIAPDGGQKEIARLPSMFLGPGESFGGGRLAMLDGKLYATSGAWASVWGDKPLPGMATLVKIEDGKPIELLDTWDYETAHDPDKQALESNPYGLAAGPDGKLWLLDSAGNDLLKIDPATGAVQVVAVFEMVPSPIPNAERGGVMATDAVPTGLAFDDAGNVYVSYLPGFPFVPGSAKVVKVTPDGAVSDYATGLTMLTDLRRGPDGQLYAITLARFTDQGPQPNTGAVVRVKQGEASEEIVTGLSFPTSIDFNTAGDAYVTTNGMGEPGKGEVVVYKGLAKRAMH